MKESTAIRYYQDWKKLGPNFEKRYQYIKKITKEPGPGRDHIIKLSAKACGVSTKEFEIIMAKPHALRQLMNGKLQLPGHTKADYKLQLSLHAGLLISNHITKKDGKIEDVLFALDNLLNAHQETRIEDDIDTKEENQKIWFIRETLKAADILEQEGRVKPDKLSEQEINQIIKVGIESRKRANKIIVETEYWCRIAELMGDGLTSEQARDKIYNDLVEKGDLEVAGKIREYQNRIHPLKGEKRLPES